MGEGGFGRPIGQAFGQAPVAGHARHQAHMPVPLRQQARQHCVEHAQGAGVVDILVAQHVGQVEVGGIVGLVVAGAVHHPIKPFGAPRRIAGLGHARGIGHVHRQGARTRVLRHKIIECGGFAGRHTHHGPSLVQGLGAGAANARGCANQPHPLTAPRCQRGVQSHVRSMAMSMTQRLMQLSIPPPHTWVRMRPLPKGQVPATAPMRWGAGVMPRLAW